jgi:hypothetical protein
LLTERAGFPWCCLERRDRLCRSFLVNTVHLAADLVAKEHIHVVGSDREVAAPASELGVGCEGEADIDRTSTLTCSVARILERKPGNSTGDIWSGARRLRSKPSSWRRLMPSSCRID